MKQIVLVLLALASIVTFAKTDSGEELTTIHIKVESQTKDLTVTKKEYAFLLEWFRNWSASRRPATPYNGGPTLEFRPGRDGIWRLGEYLSDPHATQSTKEQLKKILTSFGAPTTPPSATQRAEAGGNVQ